MDPNVPRRPRSLPTVSYRFGHPGSPEHTYYLLSRFLRNIQGGLHLGLEDGETRTLSHVKASINAAYLPVQSREPVVIMANEFARVLGPLNEDILQFMLLGEQVESVAHHGATRERGGQIHLQEDNPGHEKLKQLVSHIIQVLEPLGLFGRRTVSFQDLRIIVDSLFPEEYDAEHWTSFRQSGHQIVVTAGCRKKRAVVRHSANGFYFYSLAKVYP